MACYRCFASFYVFLPLSPLPETMVTSNVKFCLKTSMDIWSLPVNDIKVWKVMLQCLFPITCLPSVCSLWSSVNITLHPEFSITFVECRKMLTCIECKTEGFKLKHCRVLSVSIFLVCCRLHSHRFWLAKRVAKQPFSWYGSILHRLFISLLISQRQWEERREV
jgi:hypothetical protein